MTGQLDEKIRRFRKTLNLERADRLSMGDFAFVEYRPDVYHLGDGSEPVPEKGRVGRTRDGIFAAIHERGRKALYVGDGNYLPFLDDLLDAGSDGLYIESSSMDPRQFMSRAGRDRFYLLKTSNQNIDVGAPDDIRAELEELRDLHVDYPGICMYRGAGAPRPGNAEAFAQWYERLLIYS